MKFLRSIFGESDEPGHPAAPVDAGPDPVMAALAELEVKRLREALGGAAPMVETVRGAGYRLTGQPQVQLQA